MHKDFAAVQRRPFMPDDVFVALVECLSRIHRERLNSVRAQFWQQDWKKQRRRAWSRRRSSGLR